MHLKLDVNDHVYRVHMANGSVQYIIGPTSQLVVHIDAYMKRLDFHVIKLQSIDVILGYPWFYNKNPSLSIDWVNHSIIF